MNRLQHETSPYLLQHAENPVDWYPWGEEALQRAKAEDKPILVSIGYSTCHWCHVMERESFEDEATAAYMNQHFVCIKVDREERPDVDQLYMEACQAISGGGGWPLNAFLLPDLRPFYAGTYYPPEPRHRRPSWRQLMEHLIRLYREERAKVEEQAAGLSNSIAGAGQLFIKEPEADDKLGADIAPTIDRLRQGYDLHHGGFGGAPKFPMSQSLELLLEYGLLREDAQSIGLAEHGMQAMIAGGIYDQLGGGFSRYTVDTAWRVPHFEKMLYDNALLLRLLAKLQLWQSNPIYPAVIDETVDWLRREMRADDGTFYSALDADSEGVEGKFYVWTQAEMREVLPDKLWAVAEKHWGVTSDGNWEEEQTNILYRALQWNERGEFKTSAGGGSTEHKEELAQAKQMLFAARSQRIRPGLDDKIILQWNALMIEALCWCHRAQPERDYLELAQTAMQGLQNVLFQEEQWHRTAKDGRVGEPAFLDDEVALGSAALELYLTDFEVKWLDLARERVDYVMTYFKDKSAGLYQLVKTGAGELPIDTINVYDNALPSGNAQLVLLLQKLDRLVGPGPYGEEARRLLGLMANSVRKYPSSFGSWARALLYVGVDNEELIITGPKAKELAAQAWSISRVSQLIVCAETNQSDLKLLAGRFQDNKRLLYYCRNQACGLPVETIDAVIAQRIES